MHPLLLLNMGVLRSTGSSEREVGGCRAHFPGGLGGSGGPVPSKGVSRLLTARTWAAHSAGASAFLGQRAGKPGAQVPRGAAAGSGQDGGDGADRAGRGGAARGGEGRGELPGAGPRAGPGAGPGARRPHSAAGLRLAGYAGGGAAARAGQHHGGGGGGGDA